MARRLGYLLVIHADGSISERDLVKCQHCQRVLEIQPGTWGQSMLVVDNAVPGGYRTEAACFCASCFGPICPACDATGRCDPYQRGLEREEAAAALTRAMSG